MILARLLSATPTTDGEHWDLTFRRHYDAWNTDAYGQNPAPFQRNPQLGKAPRPPYSWRPGFSGIWGGFDALFPGLDGFRVVVNQSNSPTTLDIYGQTPVNAPPSGNAPQCPLEATVATTGGTIVSGSYLIAIAASASGPVSQYLIKAVVPPGTTTGTITVSGVVWQSAAPLIGVYAGLHHLAMHSITPTYSWVGSSADSYGNPTVFTITTIDSDGVGLPDPVFNSFLFQAKPIIHGGVWGAAPSSTGISGGSATATFAGAGWSTNQWAGYVLSSYGTAPGPLNYVVASNTGSVLTFVGSHGPAAGVACVMRAKAAHITATTIGDDNFINYFGSSGLTVNAEAGNLIRIIAGTGASQPPIQILSNTATVLTLSSPWAVTPDSTSVYIIEASAWTYVLPSGTIQNNGTGTSALVGSIPIINFQNGSLLVEGLTVDVNGNWSVERYAPIREIYVPAMANSALNPGYILLTPVAGVVTIDLAAGKNFGVNLTSGAAPTIAPPINSATAIAAGQDFSLYFFQDATGGRALPGFSNAASGFTSDTGARITMDGTASTETAMGFTLKNGFWSLDSWISGKATS